MGPLPLSVQGANFVTLVSARIIQLHTHAIVSKVIQFLTHANALQIPALALYMPLVTNANATRIVPARITRLLTNANAPRIALALTISLLINANATLIVLALTTLLVTSASAPRIVPVRITRLLTNANAPRIALALTISLLTSANATRIVLALTISPVTSASVPRIVPVRITRLLTNANAPRIALALTILLLINANATRIVPVLLMCLLTNANAPRIALALTISLITNANATRIVPARITRLLINASAPQIVPVPVMRLLTSANALQTSVPALHMRLLTNANATRIVPARIMQLLTLIPASSGALTSIQLTVTSTTLQRTRPNSTKRTVTAKLSQTKTVCQSGAGGTPSRLANWLMVNPILAGWYLVLEIIILLPLTLQDPSLSQWHQEETFNLALLLLQLTFNLTYSMSRLDVPFQQPALLANSTTHIHKVSARARHLLALDFPSLFSLVDALRRRNWSILYSTLQLQRGSRYPRPALQQFPSKKLALCQSGHLHWFGRAVNLW
jgi:hypothetical protein